MDNLKFSKLLEKFIVYSKLIDSSGNNFFTAERFVLSLIMIKNTGADWTTSDEYRFVKTMVADTIKDEEIAKNILKNHIEENKYRLSPEERQYINERISDANKLAYMTGEKEITVVHLYLCIINRPSPKIRLLLARDVNPQMQDLLDMLANLIRGGSITESESKLISELISQAETEESSPKEILLPMEPPSSEDIEENEPDTRDLIVSLISDVKEIRNTLSGKIFGQDNAVNVFANGYFQSVMESVLDKERRRPKAAFLFAGPPGVGKTFMAEEVAKILKLPCERFDMSEYSSKDAAVEFCGSDAVFQDSNTGNFTSWIEKNPQSIIILDEIEKAHISIIHLFLSVLDAGRIRDSNTDKEISLKDTILIFTTNAGRQLYEKHDGEDLSCISRKVVLGAIRKDIDPKTGNPYFPEAICSRFATGNVVMFNHVGANELRAIAKDRIGRRVAQLKETSGINTEIDESVYTALLLSEGIKGDARATEGRAISFFNAELYELMRLIDSGKKANGINQLKKIKLAVDLKGAPGEIVSLFELGERGQVLILSDEKTCAACALKCPDSIFYRVQNAADAINVIKDNSIDMIILDMSYGADYASADNLNIEDRITPARELLCSLREDRNTIPVYLLEKESNTISEEEKVSFIVQGIKGFLQVSENSNDSFKETVLQKLSIHYQQESMIKLARENKIVTFETAQTVSQKGTVATIKLFDFKKRVAVDSEDADAIVSEAHIPDVTFNDVLGAEDAKEELSSFIEYLKNPKKYLCTGVRVPKGVLLYGPPGTGKTMLAKAMAHEAKVSFIAAEGNQFLKRYVGEGPEKVHEIFQKARKYAPSILFIDEIEAVAKQRSEQNKAGDILTALLTEMDGFINDPSKPVFVLAATNYDVEPGKEMSLDSALLRRFDRRIYIDLPYKDDRKEYLLRKVRGNKTLSVSDDEIENIATRSVGMSLADIDSFIELALRSAIRQGSAKVDDAIFEEAFETFNSGEKKKWDPSQLERVARHEAGHAIVCYLCGEKPTYLTVVARANHGGYMQQTPAEGKAIYTPGEMKQRIRISLGGRAAEIVYYGKEEGASTGAMGDLAVATNLARQMVCSCGMVEDFGLAVDSAADNAAMSLAVREAVNKILRAEMDEAIKLIEANKDKLDSLVQELILKNHLNAKEIEAAIECSVSGII